MNVLLALLCPFLVLGGLVGAWEYQLYAPDQRAAAPVLARAFLAASLATAATGLAGVGLLLGDLVDPWLFVGPLVALPALTAGLQALLHRRLGLDASPLTERYFSS